MTDYQKSLYKPATLCELCENACGKCSWSKAGDMKPVEGWDAIRKDLFGNIESYIVLDCPQFVLEEKNAWAYEKFNREAIREKYGKGGEK